jgi:integrase
MATIKIHKKSKRQPCYRLSYRDPMSGIWRQKLLHCSRDEAEQIRKRIEAEFTWYDANPHLIKEAHTLSLIEVIEQFIEAKKHQVSPSTIERYRFGLNYVKEALGSKSSFAGIKKSDVDKVISSGSETLSDSTKSLSVSSINTVLRHFKILLNWAYDRGLIEHVPPIKQLKLQKKPIRWLTKDDVNKVLDNCSEAFGDLVKLYILTGARRNEILYCEWKQIDLKSNRILLPRVKSKQKEYLYLNKQAKSIILKYRGSTPRPFQWTKDQVRHEYARTCTKAEITSTIHDLRRTCGARLVEKGVDIFRVSKFLRHSSVKVTQDHYVDLLPSDYPLVAENIEI